MSKKNKSQYNKPAEVNEEVKIEDITVEITPEDGADEKVIAEAEENIEEVVEEANEEPETVEENSVSGFYVSLGPYPNDKMILYRDRLGKAGISHVHVIDGEVLVGPYDTKEESIKVRRLISTKGLKGKILSK